MDKFRIADRIQKRQPTWKHAYDRSVIRMQVGGKFWRRDHQDSAPTRNIDLRVFKVIDETFVQLVNNVPDVPRTVKFVTAAIQFFMPHLTACYLAGGESRVVEV